MPHQQIPDLSKWNINNIYDTNSFLEDCSSYISLPNLFIRKVENKSIINIFKGCIQLSSLPDLSKQNNNYFNYIFKSSCLIINFPLKINKYLFYLINY